MVIEKIIISVALLFLLMIPGIILKKCALSGEGFGKGLSNLILYIAQPAMVFLAYVRPFSSEIMINAIYVFIFSLVAHALFTLVAFLLFKKAPEQTRKILRFAVIFSNAAYMGMPLIEASMGAEAVLYASIYNITFNLFLWTVGVRICDKNAERNALITFRRVIIHPVTIAAILGLCVFILPIDSYIPAIVIDAVTMIKNLVAPLSMIIIGIRLAEMDFKSLKQTLLDKNMYLFLALRHFLLPLAVFAIMRLCALVLPISDVAVLVTMILVSTPSATATTMFAEKYDCDAGYASRLVTISTLLSIVSMPIMLLLTQI